jgi:hypothetical protein
VQCECLLTYFKNSQAIESANFYRYRTLAWCAKGARFSLCRAYRIRRHGIRVQPEFALRRGMRVEFNPKMSNLHGTSSDISVGPKCGSATWLDALTLHPRRNSTVGL